MSMKFMPVLAAVAGLLISAPTALAQEAADGDAAAPVLRIDVPPPGDAPSTAGAPVAQPPPAANLRTIVAATQNAALNDTGSVVYATGFRQAWEYLGGRIGSDPQVGGDKPGTPAVVKALNDAPDTDDVGFDDAVAMAGPATEAFAENLDRALKAKFGRFAPPLPKFEMGDANMVVFSCLQARLRFAEPFVAGNQTMPFRGLDGDQRVAYYGCGPRSAARYSENVTVINYASEDDFTLVIDSAREGEKIVLAKLPNPATLSDAIITVAQQANAHARDLEARPDRIVHYMLPHGSQLLVPVIETTSGASYPLLHGPITNNEGTQISNTYSWVRLLLDQAGATDRPPAAASNVTPAGRPLNLVFNKPFLAAVWKDGAPEPYLAVWVNGGDVLRTARRR